MNIDELEKKYEIEDGEHRGEVIVSWIITHACQEKCAYCISPEKTKEIMSLEEHLQIQNQLIETGLTKNRYIGGEPLIVPHIARLIQDASEKGVNTRISTNGILLTKEKLLEIKNYLNSVAFPFESTNDDLNRSIRGSENHRELIQDRIKMVKDTGNIGVLINTCVHKENLEELEKSGYILSELGVDHWKLRKFYSGQGRGAVPNRERFDITDEEFYQMVEYLKKKYPKLRIDGRMPEKLATRLMLSPQGELYRMANSGENISYGNVLTKKLNIRRIYDRDHCN